MGLRVVTDVFESPAPGDTEGYEWSEGRRGCVEDPLQGPGCRVGPYTSVGRGGTSGPYGTRSVLRDGRPRVSRPRGSLVTPDTHP